MPRLSDSMEEGVVARWVAADGDLVTKGQQIVEIDTDKTTMGFEAEQSGRLKILVAEGQTVSVGEPIAAILDAEAATQPALEAALGGTSKPGERSEETAAGDPTPTENESPGPTLGAGRATNISPVARRLARKLGVDITEIVGTGPGGRVRKQDVRGMPGRAGAPPSSVAPPQSAPPGQGRSLERVELLIAERMALSHAEVPAFYVESEIDVTELLGLRREVGTMLDVTPTLTDFLIKAAALTLRRHPRLNSSYRSDQIVASEEITVGIAVATEGSLVVPRLVDVEDSSVGAIAARSRDLIERARSGSLRASELEGASFTISNLGMFGVTRFTAIVNQPQAAILTVGAARRTPVYDDHDQLVARDVMSVGLVSDHRVVYGEHAAAFMQTFRAILEKPLSLLA